MSKRIDKYANAGAADRYALAVILFSAAALALCRAIGADAPQQAPFPVIISVNTTFDATTGADDVFPGDGNCESQVGPGVCTLRAAIEESNAHGGTDAIFFDIPTSDPGYSNGTWTITLSKALPDISDAVNIDGPGADKLTISGNSTSLVVFNVTTSGTVTLSGLTITKGNADYGGGINNQNAGTVNATHMMITSSVATSGGGINNQSTGTVSITNSTISGNLAVGGGGIHNAAGGTVNVTGSTLINNSAQGGGIHNEGSLTLNNSTLSGNTAPNSVGGGILNRGSANVINSTVANNSASGGDGGGIYNTSVLKLSNSTVAGNSADIGGGVLTQGTGAVVKSSLIALNTASGAIYGPDVSGQFTSNGFNLVGKSDGSTGFTAATDLTGTNAAPLNPKLGPLKYNGGPTNTIALLSGSPAIDKGTSAGLIGTLMTDQRGVGYKRTINKSVANAAGGDGTDIGAFELGAGIKAVSTKTHGSAGTFSVTLPLFGPKLGVECRKGGSAGVFTVILTFPSAVTVSDATVTPDPAKSAATASVSGFSVSGSKVIVNLTSVSQAQTLTVHLLGVSDGTNTNDVSVPMGVLLGDTDNNRSVTSNDVSLTQSKVGQAISTSNFREDVNLDGVINSTDVNLVQSKVGTKLP